LKLVIHKQSTPRSGKAWWAAAVSDEGKPRALRALKALVGAVKARIGRKFAQRRQKIGAHITTLVVCSALGGRAAGVARPVTLSLEAGAASTMRKLWVNRAKV